MDRVTLLSHFYILGTVLLTVFGQVVIKWQVRLVGPLPADLLGRVLFLWRFVTRPWVIGSMAAGFAAFLCWVMAMTRFELGYAYPFTSLAFLIVMFLGVLFFGETLSVTRITGTLLVIAGIVVLSRGWQG